MQNGRQDQNGVEWFGSPLLPHKQTFDRYTQNENARSRQRTRAPSAPTTGFRNDRSRKDVHDHKDQLGGDRDHSDAKNVIQKNPLEKKRKGNDSANFMSFDLSTCKFDRRIARNGIGAPQGASSSGAGN
jgi:hypothetical protein